MVAQAGLGRGADVDAEVAGGELDQDVALAREVAEEGGPADVGVGDHVLDPGRGDAVGRVVGERRSVDPVALVDPAGLGGRRREALARSLGAGLAVADQTPLADLTPDSILSIVTYEAILSMALQRTIASSHVGPTVGGCSRATLVFALLLVGGFAAFGVTDADAANGGDLTISPAPDTPDVNPQTQISILGVAPQKIRVGRVTGRGQRRAPGLARAYSGNRGASFVLDQPLTEGESVSRR